MKKKVKKLILSENLSALNLIYSEFKSKVKCIYIDPPYNNGEIYSHYDDSINNKWLADITERIKIMHKLSPIDVKTPLICLVSDTISNL